MSDIDELDDFDYDDDEEDYDPEDDYDFHDEIPFDVDDDPYDYIEPDPDPEEDRFMVYYEKAGDYVPVSEVPFWVRWQRFITYDWAWKVAGPFFRFRQDILRHFRHCENCGKLGCGPYYFSNTCSEECHDTWWKLRQSNVQKLHIANPRKKGVALCGESIDHPFSFIKVKAAVWTPETNDEFCTTCVARRK